MNIIRNTTVKDPIEIMDKDDKNHILYAIDELIKSVKLKNIAAQ